eukprot:146529-Hanusia_phi.AAC.1
MLVPGTRYNARGLNKAAGAGNEIESEQVVKKTARLALEKTLTNNLEDFLGFLCEGRWHRGG